MRARDRRARKLTRIRKNPEYSPEEWDALKRVLKWCVRCGTDHDLTKDHAKPIGRGGTNSLANIQVLCDTCNKLKGSKLAPRYTPSYLLPSQEEALKSLPDSLKLKITEALDLG